MTGLSMQERSTQHLKAFNSCEQQRSQSQTMTGLSMQERKQHLKAFNNGEKQRSKRANK
jgi:hypothetical protein